MKKMVSFKNQDPIQSPETKMINLEVKVNKKAKAEVKAKEEAIVRA